MNNQNNPEVAISLGLSEKEKSSLRKALGSEIPLINLQNKEISQGKQLKPNDALLALIPWRMWKNMPSGTQSIDSGDDNRKLFLVDASQEYQDLQCPEFFTQCVLAILPPNVSQKELRKAIDQARTYKNMDHTINSMAKEIDLDRELLARKNAQLHFLNTLLNHANNSLEINEILTQVQKDIQTFIPIQALNAVFWQYNDWGKLQSKIYLSPHKSTQNRKKWIKHLLSQVSQHAQLNINDYELEILQDQAGGEAKYKSENIVSFPLQVHDLCFGMISLQTEALLQLGEDRYSTLNLAINHLALVLYNALQYSTIKEQAEHDALTQTKSRQHFDRRLKEELKRHQRHNQEMSLIMLDIDYFKQINDNFGHLAGDLVLQELGKLLISTLRESDFPARYGGEEFALILPQTNDQQAVKLAERIRQKVEAKTFYYDNQNIKITISLGISAYNSVQPMQPAKLVKQADMALYQAKRNGRNAVKTYKQLSENHFPKYEVKQRQLHSETT